MFQRDYILRMVEQFTTVLAKILLKKKSDNFASALDEIQQNYKSIFGVDKELVDVSSAQEIISLLRLQKKDNPIIYLMIADFLKEEAELNDQLKNCTNSAVNSKYQKALMLYLDGVQVGVDFQTKEFYLKIDELIDKLKVIEKDTGLIKNMIEYYILTNNLSKAENLLFELANKNDDWIMAFAKNFYDRLSKKSNEELKMGNFSTGEIQQGISEFEQKYIQYRKL